MKQKMIEHESVYKNQVFELQHLYRVQKNRMDDIRKREQYEDRTRNETSSSSNALPSQMTPDYSHRQNSSRFLFTNSACSSPPSSNPEFIRSSASDLYKGKAVQDARMSFKNCASPNNYDTRPTKSRKVIDLELPAHMYVDLDEDQCHYRTTCDTEEKLFSSQATFVDTHSESNSRLRKQYALADLNEPPEAEEQTADPSFDVSWKTKHLNINSSRNSSVYSTGNGQNWFSSALKAERNKDNGRTIHQTNQSERPYPPVQVGYVNHQRPRGYPHFLMEDSILAKQNNDSIMYGKSNSLSSFGSPGGLNSPQPSYAYSANLINSWNQKSGNHISQKPISAQITAFPYSESLSKSSQSLAQVNEFHGAWHRNAIPSETPVINGSYHASSSGRYNSSSNSFLKATSPIDLNSKTELDLNVVPPNDFSNELLTWQGEAKQEDSISAVPWLRGCASNNRPEFDHQSCLTSTSSNIDATRGKEIDSGKKKLPFDINVAFEELDSTSTTKEAIRNMIDLNLCITEDEIPSWTSPIRAERCVIIDLEAPADMESEEEAAEAIVAMSVSKAAPSDQIENALNWFADVLLCSSLEDTKTDCLSSDSDSFEEMNLRLVACSVEDYFPDPPDFEFLAVEEASGGPTFVTGGRRTRRGRQKRDFQRDILPGITSLSRHEITEDIQTFGGLMRATGYEWNCGGRKSNGSARGRRRKQQVNAAAAEKQMMNNGEVMTVEDRSLTSWGKTTRRPRRQRSGPITR